jgi:hypothetical protein
VASRWRQSRFARPWPRPVIERVVGAICDPKRVRMATVVGADSSSQRGLKTHVRNQTVPMHNIPRNPCLSAVGHNFENAKTNDLTPLAPSRPRALGRAWRRTLQGDPKRLQTGRRDPPRASTAAAPAACADPSSAGRLLFPCAASRPTAVGAPIGTSSLRTFCVHASAECRLSPSATRVQNCSISRTYVDSDRRQ